MMHIFLIAISVAITFAQTNPIKLPPQPLKDIDTILGPDVNRNLVRDDVEIYIYQNITKDPKFYHALIKHTKALTAFHLAIDEKTAIFAEGVYHQTSQCVIVNFRSVNDLGLFFAMIRGKMLNTPLRKERYVRNNSFLKSGTIDMKVRNELCM